MRGTLLVGQTAPLDNPPNSAPASGLYPTGTYSLSNIESINSVNGNVDLVVPLAHLPPGPGGFSAALNLVYNSAIYDTAITPIDNAGDLNVSFLASTHGGGWSYGYTYTLWTQPRISPWFEGCNNLTSSDKTNWFKTFIRTPDGSNHVL